MKILIISDAWLPQINGVVRTYECMIPALESMGHRVRVIGPSDFKFTIPCPSYSEIKLALFAYRPLKKMIEDHTPDTIHIATEGPLGIAAQKYCTRHGIPYSTSYHTQFPDYVKARVEKICKPLASFSYDFSIKKIVKFHSAAQSVLVTTQSMKDQLIDWGVTSPIHLFTRGVDQNIFNAVNNPDIFKDLPKPIALYVGRVAIEKNIDAFLQMPWAGSKVIVGAGPEIDRLRKHYPDALFTGKKTGTDLAAHYQSADVFVFPSKTDTFGMVMIEALSCGLPIAAYPVTGPKDIVTEPLLGTLHDHLSTAAEAILKENIPEGDKNKKKREKYVKMRYSWALAAEQFIAACPVYKK
ncbi:MAG: glycosyltransferase family 1 protein [Alphaproteobacteria bacterium]|nr:glycosyltransferase family 1 protein [Alphaproteobacteria bacterium]NCT08130.1 glycosyltransferase family 1 protein [Alphaproteobacteria bacterium]